MAYFVRVKTQARASTLERVLGDTRLPVKAGRPRRYRGTWVYDLDAGRLTEAQRSRLAGHFSLRYRISYAEAQAQLYRATIEATGCEVEPA
jgi:hypothetical protein